MTSLDVTEELGAEGLPDVGHGDGSNRGTSTSGSSPLAFGPVVLEAPDGRISRFPRAVARFVAADGRSGLGWIEWNQPEVSGGSRPAR